MRTLLRKLLFSLHAFLSLIFLVAMLLISFGLIDGDVETALIPTVFFILISICIYDIFRDKWSIKKDYQIKLRKEFWLGLIMLVLGPAMSVVMIHDHISNDDINFYNPSGSPKSRWVGHIDNYLSQEFGQWLPTTIHVVIGIFMFIGGIFLVLKRFKKWKSRKNRTDLFDS